MSKIETVVLPHVGTIQLVIQSKRDIRSNEKSGGLDAESNEWFYWNRVWASEVALSEYLIQEFSSDSLQGKTILELGCGTGLAGMVCGKLGGVPTFSDKVPMVMDSIHDACRLNAIPNYHTCILDWVKVPQSQLKLGRKARFNGFHSQPIGIAKQPDSTSRQGLH